MRGTAAPVCPSACDEASDRGRQGPSVRDSDVPLPGRGLRVLDHDAARMKPTPRLTLIVQDSVSTSLRRSSESSPLRRAHHAARRTMSRNRSGVFATRASISSKDAARVSPGAGRYRPREMCTGLRSMSSSSTAALRMLRSRSYACFRACGRPGATLRCHAMTDGRSISLRGVLQRWERDGV